MYTISSEKCDNRHVILDVDRTVINNTSWYHACTYPDLLISRDKIDLFLDYNEQYFENGTNEKKTLFRKKTLDLIDKRVTRQFIDVINPLCGFNKSFSENDYISTLKLYVAGVFTARFLVEQNKLAIKFIRLIHKYYGNNVSVIFLSSGYHPFIKGVVDTICNNSQLCNLNYRVIGSELLIEREDIKEINYIGQNEKKKYVQKLINEKKEVFFLADDCRDDLELFDVVTKNGGIAISKTINKTTDWEALFKGISFTTLKERILKDDRYNLACDAVDLQCDFFNRLNSITNSIGISCISEKQLNVIIDYIQNELKSEDLQNKFKKYLEELLFKKGDDIYLRGLTYYYWLPPYIYLSTTIVFDRWLKLLEIPIALLDILISFDIVNDYNGLLFEVKLIIYMIFDHIFEALLFLIYAMEKSELVTNEEHSLVFQLVQITSDILVGCVLDKNIANDLKIFLHSIRNVNFKSYAHIINKDIKHMRELDNNLTLIKSALTIAKNLKNRKIKLSHIVSFPYGSIAMGFVLISVLKNSFWGKIPSLLHMHFSSKFMKRENISEDKIGDIFNFVPTYYSDEVETLKNNQCSVLLYDNNATTFGTIDICKEQLKKMSNKVYGAVAAINYDNMCRYFLDDENAEPLVSNWQASLDFRPVEEYVTAYNTWGKSEKSHILEEIYSSKISKPSVYLSKYSTSKRNINNFEFKICRVHNVYDMDLAIYMGASMVGIHAVYNDRIKYCINESLFKPKYKGNPNAYPNLPLAIWELESIGHMVSNMPSNVTPVILFEHSLTMDEMRDCCELYGLDSKRFYVQLQHRVNYKYVHEIKRNVCSRLILAIGLFQEDFNDYFWKIHNYLNPTTDYILIDMSKHQPDYITQKICKTVNKGHNKNEQLLQISKMISGNDVPIIIADDTDPQTVNEYIKILYCHKVKVRGVDMQNNIELSNNEQRYQFFEFNNQKYQVRIRKSAIKMSEWDAYIKRLNT